MSKQINREQHKQKSQKKQNNKDESKFVNIYMKQSVNGLDSVFIWKTGFFSDCNVYFENGSHSISLCEHFSMHML